MAPQPGTEDQRLTTNSRLLLLAVLLLFPLFPFIWFGAAQLLGPRVTFIVVLVTGCLAGIGTLMVKVWLRDRQAEEQTAELVSAASRKLPI